MRAGLPIDYPERNPYLGQRNSAKIGWLDQTGRRSDKPYANERKASEPIGND